MKRIVICVALVLGLGVGFAAYAAQSGQNAYGSLVAAALAEESNQYLIELAGNGPADLAAAVAAAGGTLVHDLSDIGAASAVSDSSDFADALASTPGIQRVTRDLLVPWLPASTDIEMSEGPSGAGDLTDPILAVLLRGHT